MVLLKQILERFLIRLIKEKYYIFDLTITNFQSFILDKMKNFMSRLFTESVPYIADGINNILYSIILNKNFLEIFKNET